MLSASSEITTSLAEEKTALSRFDMSYDCSISCLSLSNLSLVSSVLLSASSVFASFVILSSSVLLEISSGAGLSTTLAPSDVVSAVSSGLSEPASLQESETVQQRKSTARKCHQL